jgi:hypothetical protein
VLAEDDVLTLKVAVDNADDEGLDVEAVELEASIQHGGAVAVTANRISAAQDERSLRNGCGKKMV